jgi:hypothetical protein
MKKNKVDGAWAYIYIADRRGAYRIFVGKPEANRPLGRTGCRWEDNKTRLFRKWNGEMGPN